MLTLMQPVKAPATPAIGRAQFGLFIAALFVGLCIRVAVAVQPTDLSGDAGSRYLPLATNLAHNHGFSLSTSSPYQVDDFNVPVYPLFVALVFIGTNDSIRAVVIAQLLVELLTVFILYLIARELGFSVNQQVAAVCLALLCPFLPLFAGKLLTEVLATFLLSLFLLCLLRGRWAFAGLCGALALLTRPDLIIAVFGVFLVITIRSRRFKGAMVALAFAFLPLSLWSLHNYLASGSFSPLGRVTEQTKSPYAQWLSTWLDDPKQVHAAWWQPPFDTPPDDELRERTREAWQQYPIRTAVYIPAKRTVMTWLRLPTYVQGHALKTLGYLFWIALSMAAVAGTAVLARRREWVLLLLLSLVAGRLILPFVSALGAEPRYVIECLPACFILAVAWLNRGHGQEKAAISECSKAYA